VVVHFVGVCGSCLRNPEILFVEFVLLGLDEGGFLGSTSSSSTRACRLVTLQVRI
jgi:hypothetical protein